MRFTRLGDGTMVFPATAALAVMGTIAGGGSGIIGVGGIVTTIDVSRALGST